MHVIQFYIIAILILGYYFTHCVPPLFSKLNAILRDQNDIHAWVVETAPTSLDVLCGSTEWVASNIFLRKIKNMKK